MKLQNHLSKLFKLQKSFKPPLNTIVICLTAGLWPAVLSAQCPVSSQCSHSIKLSDSYGDGWNGTEITVYQNNTVVGVLGTGFTATAGNPPGDTLITSLNLCDSLTAYFVLTTGSLNAPYWSEEVGFEITAPYGAVISSFANRPNPVQGDTLAVVNILCTAPTCPAPSALGSASLSASSAEIFWTTGGASNWQIEYGPRGFNSGNGTMMTASNDTVTIVGLTTNHAYDFYVRDSCAANDISFWEGPFTFGAQTVPCDNFDSYSTGDVTSGSHLFKPWAGIYLGGQVSTAYANSAPHSLEMDFSNGTQVNYADIGTYTSGSWNIEFDIFVPSGNSAYYNIMYNYVDGISDSWGPVVSLDASGVANITDGNSATLALGSFNFNHGSWNHIENIIDLDNDTIFFKVNGVAVQGWKFSLDTAAFGNQFNAVAFAAFEAGQKAYYDNFCINPYVPSSNCNTPFNLSSSPQSDSTAQISWTTGGASAWQVQFGPQGFALGNGSMTNTTTPQIQIGSLAANKAYDLYARDSCGAGDVSAWIGPVSFGGNVIPCDDFDAYDVGLVDIQSNLFTGWNGNGGDAEISTAQAASGQNSLKIHDSGPSGFSDVVAEVGIMNSGRWSVAFDYFVPSNSNGYYNILHQYPTTGSADWALEVEISEMGYFTLSSDNFGPSDSVLYTLNSWVHVEHIIDLDQDSIELYLDGIMLKKWAFSINGGTFADRFSHVNFYSWAPAGKASLAYFDNICVQPQSGIGLKEDAPEQLLSVFPNPGNGLYQLQLAKNIPSATVKIYNSGGHLIMQKDLTGSSTIDLTSESNGLYLIQVQNEELVETHRLIKN